MPLRTLEEIPAEFLIVSLEGIPEKINGRILEKISRATAGGIPGRFPKPISEGILGEIRGGIISEFFGRFLEGILFQRTPQKSLDNWESSNGDANSA